MFLSTHSPPEWKHGWQLITPTKSFAVFAATATEKAEWMAHINKCIVDLLAKSECVECVCGCWSVCGCVSGVCWSVWSECVCGVCVWVLECVE